MSNIYWVTFNFYDHLLYAIKHTVHIQKWVCFDPDIIAATSKRVGALTVQRGMFSLLEVRNSHWLLIRQWAASSLREWTSNRVEQEVMSRGTKLGLVRDKNRTRSNMWPHDCVARLAGHNLALWVWYLPSTQRILKMQIIKITLHGMKIQAMVVHTICNIAM